ncbi:phage tail protein [Sedimentitalea sp.]|uniref:phage tail protein n=1 Tax=Sedimentitalea sp. TaxID=2048915 RepID=UPI0032969483
MTTPPFTAFNFKVRLELEGQEGLICDGAFSEVTGLEASVETETIREGGNNARQIHLAGQTAYSELTLKRGMTRGLGLWTWFRTVHSQRDARAFGEIVMLSADRETELVRFKLTGCLPVKVKAPTLNAVDGLIAIEEAQVAFETVDVEEIV